jgi:exopolysaccharide production protein ExoZ
MIEAQASVGHLQDGPTASRPTYRLIQVLRAVAALMVVAHHATLILSERDALPVGNWMNGAAGVDIFFVISGFVMTISSAQLRKTLHPARTFLARRLERIVPLYWIVTSVKLVTLLAAPALVVNAMGTPWHVIASYLFLPSRDAVGQHEPLLAVGWTLNFEMAFYALFAVILAMRAPLLKVAAPVLIVVAFASTLPQPWMPAAVFWYERPMALEFLFGILLALSVHRVRRLPMGVAFVLLACGFATILLWPEPLVSWWRGVQWGIPALAIVAAAVALENKLGERVPRWTLELGDASYSIYLTHDLALPALAVLFARAKIHGAGAILYCEIAMVLAATLTGELCYRVVELPIMRWFKGRRRTAVPANA